MQPYFFPYIGYFQLIGAVDLFILYDNIKYTKKGWINRNRFLRNGTDHVFTVPLRKDSDALDVRERVLASSFDRGGLVNQLREAYRAAPHFHDGFPVIEQAIGTPHENLFEYISGAMADICRYLGIDTRVVPSSSLSVDPALKAQDKVLALCGAVGATTYINAIGGQELYSQARFRARSLELKFLKTHPMEYAQFGAPHVPWLSIVDVIMFNSATRVREFVETGYELI